MAEEVIIEEIQQSVPAEVAGGIIAEDRDFGGLVNRLVETEREIARLMGMLIEQDNSFLKMKTRFLTLNPFSKKTINKIAQLSNELSVSYGNFSFFRKIMEAPKTTFMKSIKKIPIKDKKKKMELVATADDFISNLGENIFVKEFLMARYRKMDEEILIGLAALHRQEFGDNIKEILPKKELENRFSGAELKYIERRIDDLYSQIMEDKDVLHNAEKNIEPVLVDGEEIGQEKKPKYKMMTP